MNWHLAARLAFAVAVYRDLLRARRAASLLEWFTFDADIARARLAIDDAALYPGTAMWAPLKTSGQSRPAEGENTVKAKKSSKKATKRTVKPIAKPGPKAAKKGKR